MSTAMAEQVLQSWLSSFEAALLQRDVEAAAQLFHPDECFWRDLLTFTWNIYTAESQQEIRDMLRSALHLLDDGGDSDIIDVHNQPPITSSWKLDGEVEDLTHAYGFIQAFFNFETPVARGRGLIKLRDGKCWCLLTAMLELKGHEEMAGPRRGLNAPYWRDLLPGLGLTPSNQPYCLVVGGGHAGISLGARLRRLGVPAIVIDKNKRPGDNWRDRYRSLRIHTSVWLNHLPYIPFPDHWPVFSPKDQMGDWLEAYTLMMEIVYWASTECKSARFDPVEQKWEVVVNREGEEMVLHPKQLVLATGLCGIPNVPAIPGAQGFRGAQCHSSQLHKVGRGWAGKHCVVIGSNNSAHDICAELWASGAAQVTMVQRSSTHVLRSQTMLATDPSPFREGSKYSIQDADLLSASTPYRIMHRFLIELCNRVAEMDAGFYEDLERVGFMHDFGDDRSGVTMMFYRRGSGYYIDTGASEVMIRGEIKLKSGVTVKEMREGSVVLSDGTEVEADLVVYATGYGSVNGWVGELISEEVAGRVGRCWGLGSGTRKDPGPWERELRNMWKPTQQEQLWFHGGSFPDCRHYSHYLALQIKARMEGIPVHVYGMGKVHHTS